MNCGTETKIPVVWPPDANDCLIGKDPDAGRDWRQEKKGLTEERWLDSVANLIDMSLSKLRELVMDKETWSCSPWGHKEPHMTERLNWS